MTDGGLSTQTATEIVIGLGGGFALAIAHLAALAANVRLYLNPAPPWQPVALHAVRLAGVAAAFIASTAVGAPALVATLVGFSLGRLFRVGRWR